MTALAAIVVDTVIKSSIILLLALGVTITLRRKSAALRHAIWTAGLICALTIPFLGLILPSWHLNLERARPVEPQNTVIPATTVGATPAAAIAPSPQIAPASTPIVRPSRVILLAWLLGFGTVALILLVEVFKLARVAFGSDPIRQHSWIHLAREVSQALNLKRVVQLMRHPNAAVLGTWGALRPRVILPREAEAWSGERMRVVLGHELAHVKRNDWLVQIIAEASRVVYWFNPLFWIACDRLRRESEHACDDCAMRLGVDGPTYASHVLDLARTLNNSGQPGAAALAMASPSNLERRLVAMLNPTLNRRTASKGHVTLLILAALALTLPLAAMQPQGPPAPSRETQPANPAAAIDVIRLTGAFTTDSLTLKAENLTIDLTTGSLVARGQVSMRQAKPITHEVTTLAASTISISPAARPQQATGTISGTVSDATGALVPGVRINVTNRNTGNITAIVTNSSGAFAVPGLPPGNFDMTATLPGFQTSKASAISVQAGLNVQVKVTLRVATSVVINVVTEAPSGSCLALLGTTKADGTIYTRADCLELNAAVRNAPPRIPRVPEPDDIVILGTSPITAPSPQVAAGGRQIQRIGGDLEAGNLLFHPSPAYPPDASRIGIEGSVVLSASIGEDGTVRSVQVLDSSNPLLNQPQVVEAIQSWRFKPTFLNGQPIETTTTVTVNFTIGR